MMVYMYETPVRATDWVVLFKVSQVIHTDHPDVIRCMRYDANNAPILLSYQETKYCINSISLAAGKKNFNKKMSEALVSFILKDGSTPFFWDSTSEKHLVKNITILILSSDELVSSEDSEIIEYMGVLNCHGNQDGSKFQVFWNATAQVFETDTEAGAHLRCHAASDKGTTLNVLYAPKVTYMYQ